MLNLNMDKLVKEYKQIKKLSFEQIANDIEAIEMLDQESDCLHYYMALKYRDFVIDLLEKELEECEDITPWKYNRELFNKMIEKTSDEFILNLLIIKKKCNEMTLEIIDEPKPIKDRIADENNYIDNIIKLYKELIITKDNIDDVYEAIV